MTLVVFVILCKICVRFLLLASSGGFLLPGAQRGFFTAERGGRRQFQLAVPCQPGRFRPHASYLRKEARCRASAKKLLFTLARKYTRVCGPLCDPRGSRHEVSNHWGKLLRFLPALSFWIAAAIRYAIRSTIRLPSSKPTVFRRRKAFLLCKNPCGGTARAKKFPEEICFAPCRVCQICRTPD